MTFSFPVRCSSFMMFRVWIIISLVFLLVSIEATPHRLPCKICLKSIVPAVDELVNVTAETSKHSSSSSAQQLSHGAAPPVQYIQELRTSLARHCMLATNWHVQQHACTELLTANVEQIWFEFRIGVAAALTCAQLIGGPDATFECGVHKLSAQDQRRMAGAAEAAEIAKQIRELPQLRARMQEQQQQMARNQHANQQQHQVQHEHLQQTAVVDPQVAAIMALQRQHQQLQHLASLPSSSLPSSSSSSSLSSLSSSHAMLQSLTPHHSMTSSVSALAVKVHGNAAIRPHLQSSSLSSSSSSSAQTFTASGLDAGSSGTGLVPLRCNVCVKALTLQTSDPTMTCARFAMTSVQACQMAAPGDPAQIDACTNLMHHKCHVFLNSVRSAELSVPQLCAYHGCVHLVDPFSLPPDTPTPTPTPTATPAGAAASDGPRHALMSAPSSSLSSTSTSSSSASTPASSVAPAAAVAAGPTMDAQTVAELKVRAQMLADAHVRLSNEVQQQQARLQQQPQQLPVSMMVAVAGAAGATAPPGAAYVAHVHQQVALRQGSMITLQQHQQHHAMPASFKLPPAPKRRFKQ